MIGKAGQFARRLLRWYDAARRDLPWRTSTSTSTSASTSKETGKAGGQGGRPEAYHVLLSEFMLQQTQVSTVVPYFARFIAEFPTIQALAGADEQDVLRLWQGLGYYSRARNLHAAAKAIVAGHGGIVPAEVMALLKLPGIGRYTAGAIASLAWDTRAAILDGNVQRVLCRLNAIQDDPRDRQINARLWELAEALLPQARPGDFNSAMMELGALVCTPRAPQCSACPVRGHCAAASQNLQTRIPPARKARPCPIERRWVFCIQHRGRWLIQLRPAKGRWAGMWQFVTIEAAGQDGRGNQPTDDVRVVAQAACTLAAQGLRIGPAKHLGHISHALSHRRYEFEAFTCRLIGTPTPGQNQMAWVRPEELANYPLSRPQQRIAQLAMGGQPPAEN